MNNRTVSSAGEWGCFALALGCCVTAGIIPYETLPPSDRGICLPAPSMWPLTATASWIINTLLIFIFTAALALINKRHTIVRGTDHTLTALFPLLLAASPEISHGFTAAMVTLAVAIISIAILCNNYKARNATQPIFIIATFLSIGSMMQYAFIPLAVAVFLAAIVMKCIHVKEVFAFAIGLVAPYWIALGLGIVSPADFHIPVPSAIILPEGDEASALMTIIGLALLVIICALLTLVNMVRLYAGNSKVRRENNAINILGATSAICMAADFTNMSAYIGIMYLWASVQIANIFALQHIRRSWIGALTIIAAILTFFIINITL